MFGWGGTRAARIVVLSCITNRHTTITHPQDADTHLLAVRVLPGRVLTVNASGTRAKQAKKAC